MIKNWTLKLQGQANYNNRTINHWTTTALVYNTNK